MLTQDGTPPTPLKVEPGMCAELELLLQDGTLERMALQIVPDRLADIRQGQLGEGTPLAALLMGHTAGETLSYTTGDCREVHILAVYPADHGPDAEVAQRRAETLRKAVRRSDLTNAIAFAASFNSKWGDYDPGSLSDELDQT